MAAKCALCRAESLSIQQRAISALLSLSSHTMYPLFVLPTDALYLSDCQRHLNPFVEHRTPLLRLRIRVLQRPPYQSSVALPYLSLTTAAVKAHTLLRALQHRDLPCAQLFLL